MAKKRKLFKRNLPPVHFGKWEKGEHHDHEFEEVRIDVVAGVSYILADRCKVPGCNYEVPKDLIVKRPKGDVQ